VTAGVSAIGFKRRFEIDASIFRPHVGTGGRYRRGLLGAPVIAVA
jgi:hypothetical protein